MNSIVVSQWHNTDASAHHNYAHSYILRQNQRELFRVDLNMQQGFFGLSEFIAPDPAQNFMIEQISKVGKVKVNVFDKTTGTPLAMLCGNTFKDENEQPLFELRHLHDLAPDTLCTLDDDTTPDDYAALAPGGEVNNLLVHLPRPSECHAGFFSRVSKWAKRGSDAPKDVLALQLLDHAPCSLRAMCALAVIVHARRGLQLPTVWQDAMRKSG